MEPEARALSAFSFQWSVCTGMGPQSWGTKLKFGESEPPGCESQLYAHEMAFDEEKRSVSVAVL